MRSEGITYEFIESVTHVLQEKDNDLNAFLENIEPINYLQYYRTYIPLESIYWNFSHNMSLMVQLQGTMTYDSTYAPSFNKMKEIALEVKDYDSEWIFNIKNPDILQFLSVKYAIVTNPSELPEGLSWRLLTDNYRSGLLVYRNDDYRSLGTTYNQIIAYEEIESVKLITHLSDIVACESSDLMEIRNMMNSNHSVELENIAYQGNYLTGTCNTDESTFLVLSLPYDEGWKVFVNGQNVKTYSVNGGFVGFGVEAGNNQIEMYFTPVGFKQGAIISLIGIVGYVALIIYEKLKTRNSRRYKNEQSI